MTQEISSQSAAPEATQTNKDLNFAMLRKQLEKEQAARMEAEERASRLERATQTRDDDSDDEPYVDHKKLEKKLSNFQAKLEQDFEKKAEMKAREILTKERQEEFLHRNPNFEEVLSNTQILDRFYKEHKDLADSILKMPESFERQKLVYQNIKALHLDMPRVAEPSVHEKMEKNRKSPYYIPSGPGSSPYASVADYSPTGQQQSYQKMKELQKNMRL